MELRRLLAQWISPILFHDAQESIIDRKLEDRGHLLRLFSQCFGRLHRSTTISSRERRKRNHVVWNDVTAFLAALLTLFTFRLPCTSFNKGSNAPVSMSVHTPYRRSPNTHSSTLSRRGRKSRRRWFAQRLPLQPMGQRIVVVSLHLIAD